MVNPLGLQSAVLGGATIGNSYQYTMEEAFPDAPLPMTPFGERVVVQFRQPPKQKGSLLLPQHTQDREKDIAQIGKVVAIGKGAFLNRKEGTPWHEGRWFEVGDIVCAARFGGDRWMERQSDGTEIQFGLFRDLDIMGLVLGDPLAARTFI